MTLLNMMDHRLMCTFLDVALEDLPTQQGLAEPESLTCQMCPLVRGHCMLLILCICNTSVINESFQFLVIKASQDAVYGNPVTCRLVDYRHPDGGTCYHHIPQSHSVVIYIHLSHYLPDNHRYKM